MTESLSVQTLYDDYDINHEYVEHLKERNITEFWPPQIEAIENGLLNDDNLLVVSNPGTGKTLTAEIAMVNELIVKNRSSLYLVPYKSLAQEKYEDFKENLGEDLGFNIRIAKGSMDENIDHIFEGHIIIMTYEKFDYYIRNYKDYLDDIGCLVVDEFHKISDADRGPFLEMSITKFKDNFPDKRIVGLSATTPNYNEIADWLNAEVSQVEDWNKNELKEGVCYEDTDEIIFYEEDEKIEEDSIDIHIENYKENAIIDYLSKTDNQALVFAPTRSSAKECAENIANFIEKNRRNYSFNFPNEGSDQLAKKVKNLEDSETENLKTLSNTIKRGVAFHHAGLPGATKKIVEQGFEEDNIRVIVATATLAAGVNLPVKRIFILKPQFGGNRGRKLTTAEYKNLAGRAGRPDYSDEEGESVLFSASSLLSAPLKNNYIDGELERVESKIKFVENPSLVLDLLREFESVEDILDFLEDSFLGYNKDVRNNIKEDLNEALDYLTEWDMINSNEGGYELSRLGRATSKRLLEPKAVANIISEIDDELNEFNLILSIVGSSEFERNRFYMEGNKHYTKNEELKEQFEWDYDLDEVDKIFLTATILKEWVENKSFGDIFDETPISSIYHGIEDIRTCKRNFCRILSGIDEIIKEYNPELYEKHEEELEKLFYRVKHGLREDDVAFAQENVAYNRSFIKHLVDNAEIEEPSEFLDIDIVDVRKMPMKIPTFIEHNRRAAYSFLDGYEQRKELVILECAEENKNTPYYQDMLESDKTDFEDYCINSLEEIDSFHVENIDEEGREMNPECIVKIKDDNGDYLRDEKGEIIQVAIECKSKEDKEKSISVKRAVEVDHKCSKSDYKVTIGNPDFTDESPDAAANKDILLIDAPAFIRLMLRGTTYTGEEWLEIFSKKGKLDFEDIE